MTLTKVIFGLGRILNLSREFVWASLHYLNIVSRSQLYAVDLPNTYATRKHEIHNGVQQVHVAKLNDKPRGPSIPRPQNTYKSWV